MVQLCCYTVTENSEDTSITQPQSGMEEFISLQISQEVDMDQQLLAHGPRC